MTKFVELLESQKLSFMKEYTGMYIEKGMLNLNK